MGVGGRLLLYDCLDARNAYASAEYTKTDKMRMSGNSDRMYVLYAPLLQWGSERWYRSVIFDVMLSFHFFLIYKDAETAPYTKMSKFG